MKLTELFTNPFFIVTILFIVFAGGLITYKVIESKEVDAFIQAGYDQVWDESARRVIWQKPR